MDWFTYVLMAVLLQGTLVFAIKPLTGIFNPVLLLFMQYLGGLISVVIYVLVKKFNLSIKKRELKLSLVSGFLVSTGLTFYYMAIKLLPISIASPVQSVGIMLMQVLFGFTFLKEKLTKKAFIGLTCSILCIIFLTI